jgi:hypothetical protein
VAPTIEAFKTLAALRQYFIETFLTNTIIKNMLFQKLGIPGPA